MDKDVSDILSSRNSCGDEYHLSRGNQSSMYRSNSRSNMSMFRCFFFISLAPIFPPSILSAKIMSKTIRDPQQREQERKKWFSGLKVYNVRLIAAVLGQLGKQEKRLHRLVFFWYVQKT